MKDISASLYKLDGISKVEANLADQLVRIEGTGTMLLNNPSLCGLPSTRATFSPSLMIVYLDCSLDVMFDARGGHLAHAHLGQKQPPSSV